MLLAAGAQHRAESPGGLKSWALLRKWKDLLQAACQAHSRAMNTSALQFPGFWVWVASSGRVHHAGWGEHVHPARLARELTFRTRSEVVEAGGSRVSIGHPLVFGGVGERWQPTCRGHTWSKNSRDERAFHKFPGSWVEPLHRNKKKVLQGAQADACVAFGL